MKVAVIGGGVAGAELIRLASPWPLELTLIEPKSQIELQALYPEYLGGLAKFEELTAPLKPFCDRMGVDLLNERALRLEENAIVCERSLIEFDKAVIATGAAQNYFGIQGTEKTFSISTLEETIRARRFVEEKNPDRIMIMGSGLTGVETAAVLSESLDASIYIIEARDRVLPQFSPQTSKLIEKALAKKGVNILTSHQVCEVKEDCILFADGVCLDCDMAIWTAGIKPPEFVQNLSLPKKNGWILVDPYLLAKDKSLPLATAPGWKWMARLATKTAVEAERQAKHTARNLQDWLRVSPWRSILFAPAQIARWP